MNEEPRHPEARVMALFVDGALAQREVAAVADHLRGCADCRTIVAETARFEREEEASRRPHRTTWWLAAAAVLAAVAVAVPMMRWISARDASPIARLVAASPKEHRVVAARLSGFPWARLQAPARGVAATDPADLKLTGAANDVLAKAIDQTAPESSHAAGVAYLLIDRSQDSVDALQRAAAGKPNDPHVWNDLAAARYAIAKRDGRLSELPIALTATDHALRLDPKFAEALFNRALILEHLELQDQARKAWDSYLRVDGASDWTLEAREHLKALDKKGAAFDKKVHLQMPADALVRQFPYEARAYGEGPILGEWADAELAGNHDLAAAKLARVRAIADSLAAYNGEQLLGDAVSAIEHASDADRASLAAAHRLYCNARNDYNKRSLGTAEKGLRGAAEQFRRAGSPMSGVAAYYMAQAAFDQHRGAEARDELTSLLASVDGRHRALAAQIRWELAVIANADGDWGTGVREADLAAAAFRSLGEQSNEAFTEDVAAHALEMIGDSDEAWSRRVRANAVFSAKGQHRQIDTMLHSAAMTLASTDRTEAAGALIDLMIGDAGDSDPARVAASLADRVRDAVRDGDAEAARRALVDAHASAARVQDAALREEVDARIALAEASAWRAAEPRAAIASLDRTIAFLGKGRLGSLLPDAYLQRARAFRAAGDDGAAITNLNTALAEVQRQRITIPGGEGRRLFLDTASQIIEETVDLQLTRGAGAEAFAVADRARATDASVPQSNAAARVPAGTAVIEYSVLPHAIALFCVSSDGVRAERSVVERRDLNNMIVSFTDKIRRRADIDQINTEGAALYRMLIAPVQARLAAAGELVIVPDLSLHALPFEALWDESRHQYLVEQFTIRFAPAAAAGPAYSDQLLTPALVIADPPAPPWPLLPASRQEAAKIAAIHGATLLTGEAATRARFLEEARRSSLIHFAGHANSDASTSYGALMLAGSTAESRVVSSSDIARLALTRHPLVVLAACGTFRGDTAHVAGMSSLAQAFLAAGARGVVGTLWEVDDDLSASLFSRLHEGLRAGASPARALRAAQIAMLHDGDSRLRHPATWSPVEYLSNL
ncbi:MAG TPA: CHAT domain-containing protein [Thermoanaerobaculia bacterium]|nr:CHAT domain-containing protein [Thermoanaerobaculia bacterium]